ncbi:MAG: hypothetical protein ACK4NY_19285 [Spirosomataceae bacterium]
MQTIFRINTNEIDYNFFQAFKKLFKNKELNIKVEEITPTINQTEVFQKLEKLKQKYPPKEISHDINISALANEINL